jgi:DNA-directed RNA polymerase subunit H (RpoH/RPB5)
MSDINKNIKIFKSRKNILEYLDELKYNVTDYILFDCNEIDAMVKTSQLDMLISHTTDSKKVYIKYFLPEKQKQISKTALDNIIEDLYHSHVTTLTKMDTLIIIIDEEPNQSNIQRMDYIYNNENIFIVMFNIKRLQCNISNHYLVPKMEIITTNELSVLMHEKQLLSLLQLPQISRYDPQAMKLLMRPNEVCKIYRHSITALDTIFYRVCVM